MGVQMLVFRCGLRISIRGSVRLSVGPSIGPSVRLSIRPSVRSVPSVRLCVRKLAQFSAVLSQNVTKKSCLVCDKSEKYAFWITLTPQLDRCCRGEAEVRIINFKTTWSEFQMPSPTAPAEAKPRCVYSILKPHGQSFITSPESVQSSCVR